MEFCHFGSLGDLLKNKPTFTEAVLQEIAEGKNPLEGCSIAMLKRGSVPSLSPEKGSGRFRSFLSECLVKDVKERASVSELMRVVVCVASY